ncbi:MAG TPA: response regulator [Stellaceae bacterium]|jgi:CheY-like chemotaxis protein|nr:response regulator [Stellaceae bacterium]
MASALGKVVVAVDDTIDNLDLLKRIVTPLGYGFHGCSDGRSLLDLLTLVQPDLILLDVEMPWLNGFDLCRSIRERPETAQTPVLFVTGRNSHADVQRALALGGNDFVVKPYDPIKLRARIGHWIQRATSIQPGPTATHPAATQPNATEPKPAMIRLSASEKAHPSMLQNILRGPDRPPDTATIAAQRPTERR